MKKVISITLALIMALSLSVTVFALDITAQTPSKDSNGVYQIGTAEELYGFAELVNNGDTSACAVLTADIVVNENVLDGSGELNSDNIDNFATWTPIGSSSKKYTGTFDGQGHTISGLYYNDSSTDYVGLFGYINNGGKISNVGVVDSYIYGNKYVGGVCGQSYSGTISACYNTGEVSGSSYYVGGVCGYNRPDSTIIACYNKGAVSGTKYVGGVCGYNARGTITDCYNTGIVSGTSDYVGGVCGNNYYGTITECYNTGEVSGTNNDIGGVCGENYKGTITACYNTGTISGTGDNSVGGVCGYNYGTITACYNTGTVSGTSDIGGVCGYNYSGGKIEYCYTNNGEVYGTNDGTVTDCAIYSNSVFSSGTVLNLLNTALSSAGYDIQFYQMSTESYPVLIDNSIVTSYTVTIPEAIKIGEAVKVSATEVTLKRVETLTVAITETSEENNAFKLSTTDGAELAYTVKNGNKNVAIGSAILKLGYTDSQGEATLNFIPEGAKFSGSYTGTVTFTISVG